MKTCATPRLREAPPETAPGIGISSGMSLFDSTGGKAELQQVWQRLAHRLVIVND